MIESMLFEYGDVVITITKLRDYASLSWLRFMQMEMNMH